MSPIRILSIDPSLRGTGYGVIESQGGSILRALDYGTISVSPKALPSACLLAIHSRIDQLILAHAPACCALEAIIFVQSHRTAISLGAARGAALLAAAARHLPIYEYAPRKVKQSVVGNGAADKTQVAFMIRALLGLTETPAPDAADALAIGITHLRALQSSASGLTILEQI